MTIPNAELTPARRDNWLWLLPIIALLVVAGLGWQSWRGQAINLTLHFSEGHGLKAGDSLRYRGIAVGQVEQVTLDSSLQGVSAQVKLQQDAAGLAQAGSRFWIVRPELNLTGLRGLDTLVGANYIGVLPGTGPVQHEFVGLNAIPFTELMEAGGLQIVLLSAGKDGLRPGAPISYRQVVIGVVVAVDLAKDASAVEARAYIKPQYVNLIRKHSKFWRSRRARFSAGLDGFALDLAPVPNLLLGGVSLSIPPRPGSPVAANARFTLHREPKDKWLDWVPGLALQESLDAPLARPQPVALRLQWQQRSWYYVPKQQARQGWGLMLETGLLAPADLLQQPTTAKTDSVQLTVDQQTISIAPAQAQALPNGIALLPAAGIDMDDELARLGVDDIRTPQAAENVVVVANSDESARFVGAERQQWSVQESATEPPSKKIEWLLHPALRFSKNWHGATVLAESDGKVLGILLVNGDEYRVARVDSGMLFAQ